MSDPRSPSGLREALASNDPIALLDVRPSLDYVRGNVPESTRVPRRDLEHRLPELVPNRSTPIVLCDDRGERAARDARWLERLGYENVDYLQGGVAAWREAGFDVVEAEGDVHATAFNYGSKEFGERVEADLDLPKLDPDELAERRDELAVVDVRNPPEYEQWGTIPGSVNVEGFDLPLYVEAVRDEDEPVVVHCAGRTRSIIGTATLRELGIDDVYELENGTMGWQLAGYDLTAGPGRPDDLEVDPDRHDRLRESAERLLRDADVPFVSPDELDHLDEAIDDRQSVYVFDVRTEAEYAEGHLPGALNVAGGQLVQTAGRHVAVRDAEIVLVSETHVRAAITAYWLDRMGFPNVNVLRGGTTAWTESGRPLVDDADDSGEALGSDLVSELVRYVTASELADATAPAESTESAEPDRAAGASRTDRATVVNVGDLDAYADGHVPGARWVPRYELADALTADFDAEGTVVLTCEDGTVSERGAAQLGFEARSGDGTAERIGEIAVLEGGVAAWREAGLETEGGTERLLRAPREATRKPYAQGEREMRRYLEWEESLAE